MKLEKLDTMVLNDHVNNKYFHVKVMLFFLRLERTYVSKACKHVDFTVGYGLEVSQKFVDNGLYIRKRKGMDKKSFYYYITPKGLKIKKTITRIFRVIYGVKNVS